MHDDGFNPLGNGPDPEIKLRAPASALAADLEEGSPCPTGCGGAMAYIRQRDCSCHIAPPCSACTDAPLMCAVCGHDAEDA